MPLSIAERKHLMPHGAQREVAREIGVSDTFVSSVMNGEVRPQTFRVAKNLRRVQVALARKLRRRVDEVFPPEEQEEANASPPSVAVSA